MRLRTGITVFSLIMHCFVAELIFCSIFFECSNVFSNDISAQKEAQSHYLSGLIFYEQGNYTKACEEYQKAIEIKPDYADAYINWGAALLDQKKYDEAIEKYKKAVDIKPDHADAYINWGNALYMQKKYDEAIEKYKKAVDIKPDYANAYCNWGNALCMQNRYDEAIEKCIKAIDIKPDYANAYIIWGASLLDQKKYDEAIEKYKKATKIKPDSADTYCNWGNTLHMQKKYDEAIKKYKKATKIKHNYADAYYNWGNTLHMQKKYDKAIEKYKKATKIKPDYADAYNNWGNTLHMQKRYDEAIEKYKKATKIKPDSADAYYNWGSTLHMQNRYDEAIEQYKKAIEKDPNNALAYNNWGNALYDQKKYDEAIEEYQKATKIKPDYAYHNIANTLFVQGKYSAGWKAWAKANDAYKLGKQEAKDNKNVDYFYNYGVMLHGVFHELDEAEEIYNEGRTLDSNNVNILLGLVNLYLEKRDEGMGKREKDMDVDECATAHGEAWKAYRQAESLLQNQFNTTKEARILLQLSDLYLAMEEYEEAKKTLEDKEPALSKTMSEQELVWFHTNLGVVYASDESNTRIAVKHFKDAVKNDLHNLTLLSKLAKAHLKDNNIEDAEAEYKKILRITDGYIEAQIGLGEVYKTMGDQGKEDKYEQYEEAIRYFNKGIELASQNNRSSSLKLRKKELAAAYYSRGYTKVKFYESKEFGDESLLGEALEDFKKCTTLDPNLHKAERAGKKLKNKLDCSSSQQLTDKYGRWVILIPSFIIFFLGVYGTFSSKFGKSTRTNAIDKEQESIDSGFQAGGLLSKYFDFKSISLATCVTLIFGSLIFIVVGLYLPQLLRLKIGTIELEKGSVNQITTTRSIGISK